MTRKITFWWQAGSPQLTWVNSFRQTQLLYIVCKHLSKTSHLGLVWKRVVGVLLGFFVAFFKITNFLKMSKQVSCTDYSFYYCSLGFRYIFFYTFYKPKIFCCQSQIQNKQEKYIHVHTTYLKCPTPLKFKKQIRLLQKIIKQKRLLQLPSKWENCATYHLSLSAFFCRF